VWVRLQRGIKPSTAEEFFVLVELRLDAVPLAVIAQLAEKTIVPAEKLEVFLAGLAWRGRHAWPVRLVPTWIGHATRRTHRCFLKV